jgi:DNA-binding transcriptional LysR family regulator
MVSLEWYRSFVAIYQTGTVSAAANKLALTQPAVSQHLAALERSFGARLFERTPRQMQPTAAGKALYAQMIGAMEQLERLPSLSLLLPQAQSLTLRVGVPREYFYVEGVRRLPSTLDENYRLELVLGQTPGLLKQLETAELDAIIATQRISKRSLHYQPLHTETFILVSAPTFVMPVDLSDREAVAWLEAQPWLSYAADMPIIRRYWQEIFGRHPNFTPRLIAPDLLMLLEGVRHGLGLSVLPEYLCRAAIAERQVQVLWQPEPAPSNQLYLACLRERLHSPEFQWLKGVMT